MSNKSKSRREIDQNFLSCEHDYDYPMYLSTKEEWLNYKHFGKSKEKVVICQPCLIMELNRLVPYLENNCIKFHALNMPYIKIGKTEIIGFVLHVNEDVRYYKYQIDDGTGTITVFHEKKQFEYEMRKRETIDAKYRIAAATMKFTIPPSSEKRPKHFPNPRPRFTYSSDASLHNMAILESKWALETNNGLSGKRVQYNDYVHVFGYCTLHFDRGSKPCKEITFEDLSTGKLDFIATKVNRIPEKDYNLKMRSWLYGVVRRRYDEHPEKPEYTPEEEKKIMNKVGKY